MNIEKDTTSYGIVSAITGALSMGTWLVPLLGALTALAALYTGSRAIDNQEDGWPMAGVALGFTGLVLTVLRSGLVYYYG